ncbi:MAG: putative Ig domain-containing protein, partial [Acidobacteriota bacterium]
ITTFPAEIVNLTNLHELDLDNNQIATIPAEIGNLTNLYSLDLSSNQITTFPAEIGNLTNLWDLSLSNNKISGTIPTFLGNLLYLEYLNLSGNALTGSIPTSLKNLTNLWDGGGLDIRYNGLYTSDATLLAFLNQKQAGGDWQSTQTVAPTGVTASSPTTNSITLSWTPIAYTADGGGYRVYYSTTSGSGYIFKDITVDKSTNSMVVDGLASGTTYYFVIVTQTNPHSENQNTVLSDYSEEVSAGTPTCPTITLSPASLPDGEYRTYYNQTIVASGGTAPYTYSITSGALPIGFNLNSTSGIISGFTITCGVFNFTVTATDANNNTCSRAYTIKICPNITLSPALLPNAATGTNYNQTISANGGTAPYTYSVISGSLPVGLTLSSNGIISGTPTTSGSFNFTITSTDSTGCAGTRNYNITVIVGNPPPEIAVGNSYSEALIFSEDKQTISWPGEATATGYKLFRGTLNDLPNLQNDNIDSCTRYFGTNTSVDLSSDDPSATAGNLYWYLVVGYNAVGDGPAGNSRIVNSQGICSGGAGNSNPWAGVHSLLPKSMYWSASCAYNGKIYVFGGNENDGEVNTTYIYDIATDTWTQGANMPTGRYLCTAVEVGGKIYVLGGRQLTASTNPVNVNECYDPATDTWTTKALMPNAIRGHSAVAANGKIYVMGGNTGAYTDVVNIYDPSSNTWSSGPKLPAKVAYGGAVYSSSKNAIYYVGGVKSSATSSSNFVGKIFKLDLSTNSWDSATEMTYKTAYFGIAANGDGSNIYIVGGTYWNSYEESPFPGIQVFNTSNNSFQYLNYYPSPLNRAYCNAEFANGRLWVLEGSASRLVDEFNENSGEWYEPIWPINDGTQLIDLSGAVGGGINGKFYVAEGAWSDIPGKVFEYDPASNNWAAKYGVDSTPRMYVSGGVWNDKLVIYGGMDTNGSVLGTATLYDPLADTFTAIGGANSRPTLFEASAILNDKLYLFGGRLDPQDAESLIKYT